MLLLLLLLLLLFLPPLFLPPLPPPPPPPEPPPPPPPPLLLLPLPPPLLPPSPLLLLLRRRLPLLLLLLVVLQDEPRDVIWQIFRAKGEQNHMGRRQHHQPRPYVEYVQKHGSPALKELIGTPDQWSFESLSAEEIARTTAVRLRCVKRRRHGLRS